MFCCQHIPCLHTDFDERISDGSRPATDIESIKEPLNVNSQWSRNGIKNTRSKDKRYVFFSSFEKTNKSCEDRID